MSNFKYTMMSKEVHILTQAEHDYVTEGAGIGRDKSFLRGKKLIINLNSVSSAKETGEAVNEKEELLRLAPKAEQIRHSLYLSKPRPAYSGLAKAVDQNDKICADCFKLHYIPRGNTCLPCGYRRRISGKKVKV